MGQKSSRKIVAIEDNVAQVSNRSISQMPTRPVIGIPVNSIDWDSDIAQIKRELLAIIKERDHLPSYIKSSQSWVDTTAHSLYKLGINSSHVMLAGTFWKSYCINLFQLTSDIKKNLDKQLGDDAAQFLLQNIGLIFTLTPEEQTRLPLS